MEKFVNLGQSTLVSGVDADDTSIEVADAASFPDAEEFRVRIGTELLKVTAVSGTTFTVERGSEGTTAASHAAAAPVLFVLTVESSKEIFTPHFRVLGGIPTLDSKYNEFLANELPGETKLGIARSYSACAVVASGDGGSAQNLCQIDIPNALGDYVVKVIVEAVVCHAGGGGSLSGHAVFRRNAGGDLTSVGSVDFSDPDLWTGTDVGGLSYAVASDTGIKTVFVKGTGIAATAVNWILSVHVIVAPEPS